MLPLRHIKSYVLRAGRVTAAQERALVEAWPRYGLDFNGARLDLDTAFAGTESPIRAQRCLEIGFGVGEVIGALAQTHRDRQYVGIEVHRAGVGRLLLRAQEAQLDNLRLICHDAVEVLSDGIVDASFDEILVFFPDPWHKKRHHKRRLIEPAFMRLMARKLRTSGTLRMATDWQEYAEQMLAVGNAETLLESLSADRTYVERPTFRPATRFERRGERLGHGVWDLAYRKVG
jgi:tRNA (guanine-N7-)-methyltransferase